ncbi:DUF3427 domain-containing protein [Gammaproteobacteria bacterium]|nr:DUF3427 domain-containing protein [Gammaproteobacteria bacterium]
MKKLILKNNYSREDVHSIFSPDTQFTPQAGTWGLHGIIKIPSREDDFVFFVTYGQSQGDHDFDEGITEDGVLSWQSQPRQGFDNAVIQTLINHNETTNNIYLFLREEKKRDYQYLGRLKYLTHDKDREKPVYFQWQILDLDEGSYTEVQQIDSSEEDQSIGTIEKVDQMPDSKIVGISKDNFRTKKSPDYALKESKNRKLGQIGEELVLKYEKDKLISYGKKDLAEKIVHTSKVEGDGAGYDIKSFNEDGSIKYIEVKATRGNINTDFYMSPRELRFAELNKDSFCLYRVFDLKKKTNNGKFFIFNGDINNSFNKIPTGFRLSKK